MKFDIVKSAGVIIENKKLLLTRTRGKSFFIAPGGKLEAGETATQSLVRELKEELNVDVLETDLQDLGTFRMPAIGKEDKMLEMKVMMVNRYAGELNIQNEIEEMMWIDSANFDTIELGPIFKHEIVPMLKQKGLID